MSEKGKDYLTKNLPFNGDEEPPKPGMKGYLEPGFSFNERGEIVDGEGNVYDEAYNLVRAAPSEGLKIARRQHPDWSDRELAPLAKIYNRQLESKKKKHKGSK